MGHLVRKGTFLWLALKVAENAITYWLQDYYICIKKLLG